MTPRPFTARRATGWGVGLALLVGAWFVAEATPDGEGRIADPFPVAASVGAPAEGRNLGVLITGATLADRVTFEGWHATGTWLVVELDAWTVYEELPGTLGSATLDLGERTLRASERPGAYDRTASLFAGGLHLGIPRSGALAFELPADAADAAAMLRLAIDPLLVGDSVIEIPLDLATLPHVAEMALPATEWTTP